jgi:type VI secretion system secreted protein Hcp
VAAVDYFLKIDTIEGESQDHKHKGEIDIESWSWGATNVGHHLSATGGHGAGKVSMQDLHCVMVVNKASPKVMAACAGGQHIKNATLTCRKAGKDQQEYLKIKLTDVFVTSYQTGGSGGDAIVPVDQFSINFSKIDYEYKEQKPDGTLGGAVKAGWDVGGNKAI